MVEEYTRISSITQRHHFGSTPRGAPWPQAWMSAKPLLRTAMARARAGFDGRQTRGRRAGHAAAAHGLGADASPRRHGLTCVATAGSVKSKRGLRSVRDRQAVPHALPPARFRLPSVPPPLRQHQHAGTLAVRGRREGRASDTAPFPVGFAPAFESSVSLQRRQLRGAQPTLLLLSVQANCLLSVGTSQWLSRRRLSSRMALRKRGDSFTTCPGANPCVGVSCKDDEHDRQCAHTVSNAYAGRLICTMSPSAHLLRVVLRRAHHRRWLGRSPRSPLLC